MTKKYFTKNEVHEIISKRIDYLKNANEELCDHNFKVIERTTIINVHVVELWVDYNDYEWCDTIFIELNDKTWIKSNV